MATIFEFPDTQEREWKEWQDLIRQKLNAEGVEEAASHRMRCRESKTTGLQSLSRSTLSFRSALSLAH